MQRIIFTIVGPHAGEKNINKIFSRKKRDIKKEAETFWVIKRIIQKNPNIKAILTPHAGLSYSGEIAEWAYKKIDWNNFSRIILLSTHHLPGNFIPESTSFRLSDKTLISFPSTEIPLSVGLTDPGYIP